MEKCYFEVGKTYVDYYRKEFTVVAVQPHYPHRSTFSGEVYQLPDGAENYYDVFIDRKHKPFEDENFCTGVYQWESFAQGSIYYEKLKDINENPKKKNFICVVPGAYVICDDMEYDPRTRDLMEYAMIGHGFKDFYHMDRLTDEERKQVEDWAEKIYKELNG